MPLHPAFEVTDVIKYSTGIISGSSSEVKTYFKKKDFHCPSKYLSVPQSATTLGEL